MSLKVSFPSKETLREIDKEKNKSIGEIILSQIKHGLRLVFLSSL